MADKKQNRLVEIVSDYGARLRNFIRSRVPSEEDTDDLLQEIWYQLSGFVDLDEIESISGWLYRVARNKIIDRYRREQPLFLEDQLFEDDDGSWSLKDILLGSEDQQDSFFQDLFWNEFRTALEELPEAQRKVFIKNEMEELTLQEIADEQKVSLKTVISRKRYAVQRLRARLQKLYDELNN